jgi:hypothetical protein
VGKGSGRLLREAAGREEVVTDSPLYQIQRRLYFGSISASEVLMPNFAPVNWLECDVFRVTKAGYFYEYEIKLSVADFRADAKKTLFDDETKKYIGKHEALTARFRCCPARFYFVTVPDVADRIKDELPDWAGLIVLDRYLRQMRPAPILHKRKISRAIVRQAYRSAMGRFWDQHFRLPDLQRIQRLQDAAVLRDAASREEAV